MILTDGLRFKGVVCLYGWVGLGGWLGMYGVELNI